MDDLPIGTGVSEPGALAGQQARGGRVGGRIGQGEADPLEVVDPLPELDPIGGPFESECQEPLHRARTACPDMDALLDEPLVGQLVGLAHTAEHRRGRHADIAQDELRVAVGERVGVVGVVLHDDAGRVVVHEKERRESPVAVGHHAMEDHEIGVVRPGDEPLLAVEAVVPARRVTDRGGAERSGVRAGLVLGDRVAPRALAAQARVEVAPPLVGVRMEQDVVGARDVRPQAARGLAELLVDEDLLEDRPALTADRPRQRTAMEPGLDRGRPDRVPPVTRHPPAGPLEFGLSRLELVLDERACPGLEFELGWRQGEVHRRQGCATGATAR